MVLWTREASTTCISPPELAEGRQASSPILSWQHPPNLRLPAMGGSPEPAAHGTALSQASRTEDLLPQPYPDSSDHIFGYKNKNAAGYCVWYGFVNSGTLRDVKTSNGSQFRASPPWARFTQLGGRCQMKQFSRNDRHNDSTTKAPANRPRI